MKTLVIMSFITILSRTARTRFSAMAFQQTIGNYQTNKLVVVPSSASSFQLRSSSSDGFTTDESGRQIRSRSRPSDNDSWGGNSDDDWGAPAQRSTRSNSSRGSRDRSGDNDDWGARAQSNTRSNSSRGRRERSGDDDDWRAPSQRSARSNSSRERRDNDDDDDWGAPRRSGKRDTKNYGEWDFESDDFGAGPPQQRRDRRPNNSNSNNNDWRRNNRNNSNNNNRGRSSRMPQRQRFPDKRKERSINMNGLEGAGFVHLYGLSSILNALKENRRDVTTSQEKSESWDDEEGETGESKSPPPPQAQFRPYLFMQERTYSSQRRGSKAEQEKKVLELAKDLDVPIAHVDKGILNTLSGNRPHQGMVLRCGKLHFDAMSRIPLPGSGDYPNVWLVLDEVVDPQNLGGLIRSAYFLGQNKVGVMVCSKNSAPPTPVVSAASAGALEVSTVYSTNNLPRTMQHAAEDGFRIVGASSSIPSRGDDEDPPLLYDLQNLPSSTGDDRPILLVLGSEGHGLRTLVAKSCTEFVRIPSGIDNNEDEDEEGAPNVDSLNVSVTGGILLWHLLHGFER